MEVAGRWRHQWAGTAEYGKMVDGVGGVTRMARALEVRTSSGPGARVRVTKAAFHSAGPLSTSYVFHSSKRTILSSRVESENLVSPTLVWRPQEISSVPLDVASDSCPEDNEPYKVTEPDDSEISEPSKWRPSHADLSEESSSVDTASLVDSSVRVSLSGRPTDSSKTSSASSQSVKENDTKAFRSSFRRKPASEPLMKITEHAKCLESSKLLKNKTKDEWHDRRNSYGFETSTLNSIKSLSEDDKIGIESSTDSGICKSSEVVNIPIKRYSSQESDYFNKESKVEDTTESFQDWLAKNRSLSTPRPDYPSIGRSMRDNGTIQFKNSGKIYIQLQKNDSTDDEKYDHLNIFKNLDSPERKKKVEFCKTELHFAAESGVVNIIETDDKPPPKHDFRKRRSAFVPINNERDKSITLFGGTFLSENNDPPQHCIDEFVYSDRLTNEYDNDLNVKSILKNKIPKPKPYLLGEDIDFDKGLNSKETIWGAPFRRTSDEYSEGNLTRSPISILNESLKHDNIIKNRHIKEIDHYLTTDAYENKNDEREYQSSPVEFVTPKQENKPEKIVASTQTTDEFIPFYDKAITSHYENKETNTEEMLANSNSSNFVHEKLKLLQLSPIMLNQAKTRQLRQNELSYFGVKTDSPTKETQIKVTVEEREEKTLKLPTRKTKHNESPIYQNIPLRPIPMPVPAPRSTKELQKKVFEKEQKSPEKKINASDSETQAPNSGSHRNTRALVPINELRVSKHQREKNASKEKELSKVESKHKVRSNNSSPIHMKMDSPTKKSIKRTNSKESVHRSRESSVEDLGHNAVIKPCRRSNKERVPELRQDDTRKSGRLQSDKKKLAEVNQNSLSFPHNDSKEVNSNRRSKTRSNSVDSNRKTPESVERRNHSVDRSHRENEHYKQSGAREKYPRIIEEPHSDKSTKNRFSHFLNGSLKDKTRKREHVINYYDKNGAPTGHSKHHSSKKRDTESKTETKPKEVTITSRVATLEMKSPMLIKEQKHRAKCADPRISRKKHREESLQ